MATHRPYPRIPTLEFASFIAVVRRLRRHCPWDRKQTHGSLRESLIEEAYEVVETLDRGDTDHLREELGDLLLHIAMHATIAEQAGEFTLREVIGDIEEKLIRRHPHVFGNRQVRGAGEVKANWEALKMREGRRSVLEGVPNRLPALQRAMRIQERASKAGFDWKKRADVWKKVREEIEEVRTVLHRGTRRRREEEFGDLLFSLVNYARFIGVNPEQALRGTVGKFVRRFRFIERALHRRGTSARESTLAELDRLWEAAKRKKRGH